MSRPSLRLDDGLLDRSLPHGSASFSVGGSSWRSSRSLKSRRSQRLSMTCSESLLGQTPRKGLGPSLLNSSVHSVASDASLLSSMLDESIQESTLVETFWGLDQDVDPKESTIIAEQSTILSNTLIGSDSCCPEHPVQPLSRVYCKDCESDRKQPVATYCASSSSSVTSAGHSEPQESETSTIYRRDRRCKSRKGVLEVLRAAGVSVSRWSVARVVSLLVLFSQQLLLLLHRAQSVTDVLQLWLAWSVLCVRRAAATCGSALSLCWQVCRGRGLKVTEVNTQTRNRHTAGFSQCGVMSLKESTPQQKQQLHPTTSLCKAAGEVFRLLSRLWRKMSNSFLHTRFLLVLVIVLVPLLLLLGLCWLGPVGLSSVLPAVNTTEQRPEEMSDVPGLSSVYSLMSSHRQSAGGAVEETGEEQTLYSPPPPAETPTGDLEGAALAESVRLGLLEQSLAALWQHVEARGQRAEQRHGELLQLYSDLQQRQLGGDGVEPWLSGLLDQQLDQLKGRLDQDQRQQEQMQQQDSLQQQIQATRLDQLELELQTLAARTEQLHLRQESAATVSASPETHPAAASISVDCQSHDALLADVSRLEAALADVRREVEGLSEHQEECDGLDRIQEMVSAQVREEVQAFLYGNQLVVGGGASDDSAPPELLHQWLSQQYVSGAELQAALSSLELRLLQNISLQLEQLQQEAGREESALHAATAAVTQEEVQAIVTNALRLFAQDRTGQADYALESGGGSILSTRCSESYESKAALLSLFGVPLWYFSQSPRAVIQPDVHPGNCWAFRGSTGFLVIRLSMRILPTSFSLEHLPKSLAPGGQLLSAPRDFSVYGLEDENQERGKLLGSYTYDKDGEALQSYSVTEENSDTFQTIEVQVLSNWGHQEYTCMYRFRVHGTPQS